jgi:hypothetical protein
MAGSVKSILMSNSTFKLLYRDDEWSSHKGIFVLDILLILPVGTVQFRSQWVGNPS